MRLCNEIVILLERKCRKSKLRVEKAKSKIMYKVESNKN